MLLIRLLSLALLLGVFITPSYGDISPTVELLLPGGMIYSVSSRTYRSLHLPLGWTVNAGAYSPDSKSIALLLVGTTLPPPLKGQARMLPGPVNKVVRTWRPSSHVIVLNRDDGSVRRSWLVPYNRPEIAWTVSWSDANTVQATALPPGIPSTLSQSRWSFDMSQGLPPTKATVAMAEPPSRVSCPATLAETTIDDKKIRFTLDAATCSTPPDPNDVYSLLHDHPPARPEILWQYRVAVSTAACLEPYACYTGNATQFLSSGNQHFLAWDADLYRLTETSDGMQVALVTQWLPQYSHPWGIASGETNWNASDVENKETFQPANASLTIPHTSTPQLVAQNFCPTKSFNAEVTIGTYKKSVMVPAGNQVGPIAIESFSDQEDTANVKDDKNSSDQPASRAYTPLLVSLTWTSFHHISEPISCSSPYTITPNTNGILLIISEKENGTLHCDIQFQDIIEHRMG